MRVHGMECADLGPTQTTLSDRFFQIRKRPVPRSKDLPDFVGCISPGSRSQLGMAKPSRSGEVGLPVTNLGNLKDSAVSVRNLLPIADKKDVLSRFSPQDVTPKSPARKFRQLPVARVGMNPNASDRVPGS